VVACASAPPQIKLTGSGVGSESRMRKKGPLFVVGMAILLLALIGMLFLPG
jgi:hypothetical protein